MSSSWIYQGDWPKELSTQKKPYDKTCINLSVPLWPRCRALQLNARCGRFFGFRDGWYFHPMEQVALWTSFPASEKFSLKLFRQFHTYEDSGFPVGRELVVRWRRTAIIFSYGAEFEPYHFTCRNHL